ncbi:hypothetical protein ROLI_031840 [Roseobacter fucihabitans]|uniref:DUF2332 domain-containing protein n=1 Tax=Roseobacter fucihabitans TaxID=1537242 RepID=A0ABZ2BVT5_9RHOB|nr:DUF2332 family protein [Roseobacter litoralis]MBC6964990.1 hypothetical protein [Roseobacter litoralis]
MSLAEAFAQQAASCEKLGSPFMGQLLRLLAVHWPMGTRLDARLAQFDGDIGPAGASLPLRIAGGLHALVLSNRAARLQAVYPPQKVSDATLLQAVLEALAASEDFMLDWVESPPQTNEVRRSAALLSGACVAAEHFDLPFILSELGASGGLNLMWDDYAVALPALTLGAQDPVLTLAPEWTGAPPPRKMPVVAGRAGVDLNPLDPSDPDDVLRLTAYLWPDQPHRLALTHAAARNMTAPIARGDAIDWLATRLATAPEGHVHLIQHTVAWQYFPPDAQNRGTALIEAAGRKATAAKPLAWLAMESDGDRSGAIGAALTLRLWPGDIAYDLARVDFHGRWVKWTGARGRS